MSGLAASFPGLKLASVLQGHPKLDVSHIKLWSFKIIQSKIAPQTELHVLEEARMTGLSRSMLATVSQDTTNFEHTSSIVPPVASTPNRKPFLVDATAFSHVLMHDSSTSADIYHHTLPFLLATWVSAVAIHCWGSNRVGILSMTTVNGNLFLQGLVSEVDM
jgi:hypothetical protein